MASIWIQVLSSLLLFCLVFGMTATVEVSHMKKQIHNRAALCIGACIQFIILPFIGCITVLILHLPIEIGITLLVITSSPGGSYSNWWCSMFNADLALSVTMTALSTILATIMLPINLLLYTRWIYSASVLQSLDWTSLFISLIVVLSGIISGLCISHYTMHKHKQQLQRNNNSNNKIDTTIVASSTQSIDDMRRNANRMGNCAGLALILLSVTVSSSNQNARLWDQDISFYMAGAIPPIIGLLLAVSLASHYKLEKPECVAVSIESCYQNTGIATTVALTMFQKDIELTATAIGVPLYYGIIEAIVIFTFCIICWKIGWTKAPSNENICKVITTSYEVEQHTDIDHERMDVEIVYGGDQNSSSNNNNGQMYIDMIFSKQTENGEYIVDEQTLQMNYDLNNNENTSMKSNIVVACSKPVSIPMDKTSTELDGIIRYNKQPLHSIPDSPIITDSPTLTEVTDSSDYSHTDNDTITNNIDQIRMKSRLGGGRKTLSNIRAFATGYRRPLPIVPYDDADDDAIDSDVNYVYNNSNNDIIPTSSMSQEQTSFNTKFKKGFVVDESIDTNQLSSSESKIATTNATKKISDVFQKANHTLVVKRQRKNKYYETIQNHHSPRDDNTNTNNHHMNDTTPTVDNNLNGLNNVVVVHTNHDDHNDDISL